MKKTVKLREALQFGGKEVTEVEVRRSTIGDEEDAMQDAVRMKRGKNPLTVEMCLLSRVSRVPYDVLRSMYDPDYVEIRQALNELNGGSRAEANEDDENPMTLMQD